MSESKNPLSEPAHAPDLLGLDDAQLKDFVASQPERNLVRLLQSLDDQELQLRIIRQVTDEPTLKRVIRSELDKKLKRAAEKALRETGSGAEALKNERLARLGERIRAFLAAPKWDEATELLRETSSDVPSEGTTDEHGPTLEDFLELRGRLQRETEEYDRTCVEMDGICDRLEAGRSVSKAERAQLRDRWQDIRDKYKSPRTLDLIARFDRPLESTTAAPAAAPGKDKAETERHPREARVAKDLREPKAPAPQTAPAPKDEKQEQRERHGRLQSLDALLRNIQELSANLAPRQSGARLKELQTKAASLRRWKREYPDKLDEAEAQLAALAAKRPEAIQEAEWESWARTDRATRIQGELEKLITELEAEPDAEAALLKSAGLGQRLLDYSKEMKELGSLDRRKDHKIWEKFKALSDRGGAIGDRMRVLMLEKLRVALSEHTGKALEAGAQVNFKATAFEDAATARLKELQSLWRGIGGRPLDAGREAEAELKRLFETYFRQLNMRAGRQQRTEANALQKKRELVNEMKIAAEGKSTLISRTRVARTIEERWRSVPMPESEAAGLQAEFEAHQARLGAELEAEMERHATLTEALEPRAAAILKSIVDRDGTKLSQAMKTVTALEAELQTLEKSLEQYEQLRPRGAATPRFREVRERVRAALQQCRDAATQETSGRTQERDRVLKEAEALALSTDREASLAKFAELKELWKKVGALGQSEDAVFERLFDNLWRFHQARMEAMQKEWKPEQKAQARTARQELIYSLEALTRFRELKDRLPLPFDETERARASSRVLSAGLSFRHALALDPKGGVAKETAKIMDLWRKNGAPDDGELAGYWTYYLDRVKALK